MSCGGHCEGANGEGRFVALSFRPGWNGILPQGNVFNRDCDLPLDHGCAEARLALGRLQAHKVPVGMLLFLRCKLHIS